MQQEARLRKQVFGELNLSFILDRGRGKLPSCAVAERVEWMRVRQALERFMFLDALLSAFFCIGQNP